MKSRDELIREIEVLRDRISRLTAASLPVSTVLREVINSARVLTALVWCHCDRRRFGAGPRLRHLQFRGQRAPTDGELARRAAKLRALPRPAGNTADARLGDEEQVAGSGGYKRRIGGVGCGVNCCASWADTFRRSTRCSMPRPEVCFRSPVLFFHRHEALLPIHLVAATDPHHQDTQSIALNVADHAAMPYPITPQLTQRAGECLAQLPWILQSRDPLVHVIDNASCHLLVELAKLGPGGCGVFNGDYIE